MKLTYDKKCWFKENGKSKFGSLRTWSSTVVPSPVLVKRMIVIQCDDKCLGYRSCKRGFTCLQNEAGEIDSTWIDVHARFSSCKIRKAQTRQILGHAKQNFDRRANHSTSFQRRRDPRKWYIGFSANNTSLELADMPLAQCRSKN